MKFMIIAAVMITLPAIAIIVVFFGRPMMIPALASFLINSLPFLVAALVFRSRRGKGGESDFDHH